jgi:hypothetical protein
MLHGTKHGPSSRCGQQRKDDRRTAASAGYDPQYMHQLALASIPGQASFATRLHP